MKIVHDFETRSTVEIKTAGPWKYASAPTTDVICLGIKVDEEEPQIWTPDWVDHRIRFAHANGDLVIDPSMKFISSDTLRRYLNEADVWEAHNAEFERAIWTHVMTRYGFRAPPLEQFDCTAARAAAQNLPRQLEQVCEVLRLPIQKDMEGHQLMLKLCKPRTPRMAEREAYPDWANYTWWHEEPEDLLRLIKYCLTDVRAESLLSRILYPLRPLEREIWLEDQVINQRGVPVDFSSCASIVDTLEQYKKQLLDETGEITDGAVRSPRQVQASKTWLYTQGIQVEDLQKNTVEDLLKTGSLPPKVHRFLEIRQALAKASTGKFQAIIDRANHLDDRCRSLLMYHGAGTGRWAAKAIQPHNMPRDCYKDEELELVLDVFGRCDLEAIHALVDDPFFAASRCIRGMIQASPGHDLICSDFASIEAIAVAWVAGQQEVLDDFAAKRDLYIVDAQGIFGVGYDDINKEQRQIGKVSTLALGYGGGIQAYGKMAQSYGVDLEGLVPLIWPTASEQERSTAIYVASLFSLNDISVEAAQACDVIKQRWRAKRPKIVALWANLERASVAAVDNPGTVFTYRQVKFVTARDRGGNLFLFCKLPSGRNLYYFEPRLQLIKAPWGQELRKLTCMTVDSQTYQWVRRPIIGTLLTENVVQAMCRDLMAEALLRLESYGYPPILHVHDEIVAEIPETFKPFGAVEEFEAIMSEVPDWAAGLPIRAAGGWRGKRYRK